MAQQYRLTENLPQQLVFEKKSNAFLPLVFGLIGLGGLIGGGALVYQALAQNAPIGMPLIICEGGLAFFSQEV